jgi:hypothetical protein
MDVAQDGFAGTDFITPRVRSGMGALQRRPNSRLACAYCARSGTAMACSALIINIDFSSPDSIDPVSCVHWGGGSPDPAIGPDTFSVRWTGQFSHNSQKLIASPA